MEEMGRKRTSTRTEVFEWDLKKTALHWRFWADKKTNIGGKSDLQDFL